MIGGAISDRRNYRNQKKLMGLQNEYNLNMLAKQQDYAKEMAGINQGYAMDMANWSHNANKEMWDYTNYENQKRHLENAGLNPALLYGMSGGGGATAAGAQGMGAGSGLLRFGLVSTCVVNMAPKVIGLIFMRVFLGFSFPTWFFGDRRVRGKRFIGLLFWSGYGLSVFALLVLSLLSLRLMLRVIA